MTRLRNTLETVHRAMAMQDFRRKRDILAQNCVRLGKVSTMRTVGIIDILLFPLNKHIHQCHRAMQR
jgi:hypothetical protein